MAQTNQTPKKDDTAVRDLVGADQFLSRAGQAMKSESLPEVRSLMLEGISQAGEKKKEAKLQELKRQQELAASETKLLETELTEGQRLIDQAKAEREKRRPVLEPTKDNFNDFVGMFSVVSALTFALGGKGRGSGMRAMGALNGAMEGWNKGRRDVFDQNMKVFKAKMDEYKTYVDEQSRDLKIALELGGKRTERGRSMLKEISLRDAGGSISANIEADKIQETINVLKDTAKGIQQLRAIETKAAATAAQKNGNLSATERKDKTGSERLLAEMKRLRDSFNPSFANKKFDSVGDFQAWVNDRLRKDPSMAAWWKSYENVALPERHAMFGATLTGGERDAWRKATIGSGDSTALIKDWFNERIRILENKLDQYDRVNDSRSRPNREDDPAGILQ